eukprot:CAMPEP_0204259866 /NCGR_PEP_ID=MMETSP0468-20130131/5939_1 /ASSEMBLY_ACC=CAM_ASM_000383 /TAXON_ID=2969 /ORGANISM="Oxyrrhis marina" /LENGTH=74 /DNA_ID=CAMNT_0051234215 /DNA_START=144 /DNA_END=368 /DNA_ORIENTATION=+
MSSTGLDIALRPIGGSSDSGVDGAARRFLPHDLQRFLRRGAGDGRPMLALTSNCVTILDSGATHPTMWYDLFLA